MLKMAITRLLFMVTLLAWGGAQAAIINWTSSLDEAQEVAPSGSTASGSAFGTLDDTSLLLSWNITWSGLTGPALAMHFHGPAAPGVNAGVQVNVGLLSGLTSPSIGSATITSLQAADFLANLWYLNIHTEAFPGGEIRGQVEVPAPAMLALLGIGLAGLGLARRRKGH